MSLLRVCNVDEEGRFGGPEKRIAQVAKELQNFGVITHIILPIKDSKVFLNYIDDLDVPRSQIDITRLSKERLILLRYCTRFFWEVFLLYKYFNKERFDIVHVNGSYQVKGAIAAFLAGTPVVWHLNDTMTYKPIKWCFSLIARFVANGFIVAGQRVHDYYLRGTSMHVKPIEEIHAPVDVSIFRPYANSENICSNSVVRIVTVSGLNPTKGLEFFLRAAIRLHLIYPHLYFFIAGAELSSHKEYSDYLKKIIIDASLPVDKISFLGLVSDVPGLLNSADICVFTSISEASPTAIWEALAVGVPVVTTDVGSVRQFIQDGVSGFIVPVADTDSIVSRIEVLLNNTEIRQNFSRNGREIAVTNLDLTSAARKHLNIYKRVIGDLT